MTNGDAEGPEVKIVFPGPQKFSPEQREAISELREQLGEVGFGVSMPIRRTADTAQNLLDALQLYLTGVALYAGGRASKRVVDKSVDSSVDTAIEVGTGWLKSLFKRFPRQSDAEPPRTKKVIIYDQDGNVLKTVEVAEDEDDGTDGIQSGR